MSYEQFRMIIAQGLIDGNQFTDSRKRKKTNEYVNEYIDWCLTPGYSHMLVSSEKRQCVYCKLSKSKSSSAYCCNFCEVNLHAGNCFNKYHYEGRYKRYIEVDKRRALSQ